MWKCGLLLASFFVIGCVDCERRDDILGAYYSTKRNVIPLSEKVLKFFPWDLGGSSSTDGNITISERCHQDAHLLISASEGIFWNLWAIWMMDAQGVPDAGMYEGRYHFLGSMEQCLRVTPTYTDSRLPNRTWVKHDYGGRYCRVYTFLTEYTETSSVGVCVPDSCSKEDVNTIFTVGEQYPPEGSLTYCYEELDFWSDPSAVVAFVIVVIFVLLVLSASIVDYLKFQRSISDSSEEPHTTNNVNGHANGAYIHSVSGEEKGHCSHVSGATVELGQNDTVVSEAVTVNEGIVQFQPTKKNISLGMKLLLSFSLWKNFPAVTSANPGTRGYLSLNGLRVLSFFWIVLGHTWQLGTYIFPDLEHNNSANIAPHVLVLMQRWFHKVINNMSVAVETFFLLSGCLVTISLMKTLRRSGGGLSAKQVLMHYVHRYWRLTPVYMMIIMMYTCFYPYMLTGTTSPDFPEASRCKETWWTNMLYINTLYKREAQCVGWSWYLANDMLYFIVAPLIIIPLYKWPKVGVVLLVLSYLVFEVNMIVAEVLDLDFFYYLYLPPWTRGGSYVVGVAVGTIMYRTNCKVNMRWWLVLLLWIVGLCCLGAGVWVNLFSAAHSAFAIGVGWVVFACCTGYGGPINAFLSWKFWIPLSRLSYVGYLIHPMIVYHHANMSMQGFYVQDDLMTYLFLGFLTLTIGLSLAITLVFEVPFLELEKILLPRDKTGGSSSQAAKNATTTSKESTSM